MKILSSIKAVGKQQIKFGGKTFMESTVRQATLESLKGGSRKYLLTQFIESDEALDNGESLLQLSVGGNQLSMVDGTGDTYKLADYNVDALGQFVADIFNQFPRAVDFK